MDKENQKIINKEDILYLYIISKLRRKGLPIFDMYRLMVSLYKYSNSSYFKYIFNNIEINDFEKECKLLDLRNEIKQLEEKQLIMNDAIERNEVIILYKEDYYEELKNKYEEELIEDFDILVEDFEYEQKCKSRRVSK